MNRIRKALAAALAGLLTTLGAVAADGELTGMEVAGAVAAALLTATAVYLAPPNAASAPAPAPAPAQPED